MHAHTFTNALSLPKAIVCVRAHAHTHTHTHTMNQSINQSDRQASVCVHKKFNLSLFDSLSLSLCLSACLSFSPSLPPSLSLSVHPPILPSPFPALSVLALTHTLSLARALQIPWKKRSSYCVPNATLPCASPLPPPATDTMQHQYSPPSPMPPSLFLPPNFTTRYTSRTLTHIHATTHAVRPLPPPPHIHTHTNRVPAGVRRR